MGSLSRIVDTFERRLGDDPAESGLASPTIDQTFAVADLDDDADYPELSVQSEGSVLPSPGCPDDGTCHHDCKACCFRVAYCGPLSGVYPGDVWPHGVRRAHQGLRRNQIEESASLGLPRDHVDACNCQSDNDGGPWHPRGSTSFCPPGVTIECGGDYEQNGVTATCQGCGEDSGPMEVDDAEEWRDRHTCPPQ